MTTTLGQAAIWHGIECGRYTADLALWEQLAAESGGPVLELGCGTGRVAIPLAAAGFAVTGVDRDPELLQALRRHAEGRGVTVNTLTADARELALEASYQTILAPMQFAHLLGGPAARASLFGAIAAHLAPRGQAALALLDEAMASDDDPGTPPLPDVGEHDGWIYSSLPIEIARVDGGLELRRLRQLVAPDGELSEELAVERLADLDPETLEGEAAAAGLRPRRRLRVPPTREHVGSIVCVLEVG